MTKSSVIKLNSTCSIDEYDANVIAGLTDSDGGFGFTWSPRSRMSIGYQLELHWTITQLKQNASLLYWVKQKLPQGSVINCGDNKIFRINTIQGFKNIVIPLFEQCPLYSPKMKSFLIMKKVISIIDNKEHYTTKGLQKLIALHQELNGPQANKISPEVWAKRFNVPFNLKAAKREVRPVNKRYNRQVNLIRQKIANGSLVVQPGYITGFTMGDGSFCISFGKPSQNLRIQPVFSCYQGLNSKLPLEILDYCFNTKTKSIVLTKVTGNVKGRIISTRNLLKFHLTGIKNAKEQIIPHFNLYPIPAGSKKQHFEIYRDVVAIFSKSRQKTLSDVLDVIELAYEMNDRGAPRKICKSDYIQMVQEYFNQKAKKTS